MTNIGKGITITGVVHASEPLTIGGTIKGDVHAADHQITLDTHANVEGAVMAKIIDVSGRSNGRLVAKELVRLRNGCHVQAEIAAPRLALEEGATFNGRVDPARTDAAFKVAEHREKA